MKKSLVVLFRFRNDFYFDVFERKHTDYLPPSIHASAKKVFEYLDCWCHYFNLMKNSQSYRQFSLFAWTQLLSKSINRVFSDWNQTFLLILNEKYIKIKYLSNMCDQELPSITKDLSHSWVPFFLSFSSLNSSILSKEVLAKEVSSWLTHLRF